MCTICITKCRTLCTKPISGSDVVVVVTHIHVHVVVVVSSASRSRCLASKTNMRSSKTVRLTIWTPVFENSYVSILIAML